MSNFYVFYLMFNYLTYWLICKSYFKTSFTSATLVKRKRIKIYTYYEENRCNRFLWVLNKPEQLTSTFRTKCVIGTQTHVVYRSVQFVSIYHDAWLRDARLPSLQTRSKVTQYVSSCIQCGVGDHLKNMRGGPVRPNTAYI